MVLLFAIFKIYSSYFIKLTYVFLLNFNVVKDINYIFIVLILYTKILLIMSDLLKPWWRTKQFSRKQIRYIKTRDRLQKFHDIVFLVISGNESNAFAKELPSIFYAILQNQCKIQNQLLAFIKISICLSSFSFYIS